MLIVGKDVCVHFSKQSNSSIDGLCEEYSRNFAIFAKSAVVQDTV